jgi:hypothetical protein
VERPPPAPLAPVAPVAPVAVPERQRLDRGLNGTIVAGFTLNGLNGDIMGIKWNIHGYSWDINIPVDTLRCHQTLLAVKIHELNGGLELRKSSN